MRSCASCSPLTGPCYSSKYSNCFRACHTAALARETATARPGLALGTAAMRAYEHKCRTNSVTGFEAEAE